jgi:hypothetical protein
MSHAPRRSHRSGSCSRVDPTAGSVVKSRAVYDVGCIGNPQSRDAPDDVPVRPTTLATRPVDARDVRPGRHRPRRRQARRQRCRSGEVDGCRHSWCTMSPARSGGRCRRRCGQPQSRPRHPGVWSWRSRTGSAAARRCRPQSRRRDTVGPQPVLRVPRRLRGSQGPSGTCGGPRRRMGVSATAWAPSRNGAGRGDRERGAAAICITGSPWAAAARAGLRPSRRPVRQAGAYEQLRRSRAGTHRDAMVNRRAQMPMPCSSRVSEVRRRPPADPAPATAPAGATALLAARTFAVLRNVQPQGPPGVPRTSGAMRDRRLTA